jgi:hypothetical protein
MMGKTCVAPPGTNGGGTTGGTDNGGTTGGTDNGGTTGGTDNGGTTGGTDNGGTTGGTDNGGSGGQPSQDIPEPASVFGLMAMGALGAKAVLKRRAAQ